MSSTHRLEFQAGAFLLRFALGWLFLVAGINKFAGGAAQASRGIAEAFKDTWLPALMVEPYAAVLPSAEVALGALLVLGLFRRIALPLGGLLMVSLAFGMLVAGNGQVAAFNMFYVAMFAAALMTSSWDRWTLDRLLFKRGGGRSGMT